MNPEHHRSEHRHPQSGVTLIELIISIVILSIAVVALATVMSQSVGRSSNILLQDRSIQLAQAYLDEIMGKRYDESTPLGGIPSVTLSSCNPGPEGETRQDYDDVDDYHGLTDNPPQSQTNAGFASYRDYQVTITVSCTGLELGLGSDFDAKRIDLLVTDPRGKLMVFSTYRGGF